MDNLEDIKVGDKVVLYRRYDKKVCKIDRVTKTFVVVDGNKFRKKDGSGGYYSAYIRRATEEMIAKVEEENKRNVLVNKIRHCPLDKLSTEVLGKVYELINK